MTAFAALRDAFLEHFWSTHPVDASFAGVDGHDHRLPPNDRDAPADDVRALSALGERLAALAVPDDAAARIDAHLMRGYFSVTLAQAVGRSRFHNPAWYTGELAFGIIALLLPHSAPRDPRALAARVDAIPDWLAAAVARLTGVAVPADWATRARRECAAVARLLETGLPLHPLAAHVPVTLRDAAVDALRRFARALDASPECDPAAGAELLALIIRDVHGLASTPEEIERLAAAEFERLRDELERAAARLDSRTPWRAQVDALVDADGGTDASVAAEMRAWHHRAMSAAGELVTSAADYDLAFQPLPAWARPVYADLYFLFYRAPAAFAPGTGSTYWVTAPQSTATIKFVHAVHHGSVGHHTQNARARTAHARLARIAGGDGASGIALLGGGSLVEGWACYAEDLLAEVPEFYTARETLLRAAFELRNVATTLGDVRLHRGAWTLDEMRRFYRDEAHFSAARIWSETTRNSMFPGSRLMYWLGTRQIRELRRRSPLGARAFHDRLLSFGSAPVAAIAPELEAAT